MARDSGARLSLYAGNEGDRMDLPDMVAGLEDGAQIYACGPKGLLSALETLTKELPEGTFHFEHVSTTATGIDPETEQAFEAELTDSGLVVKVAADTTLLDAIMAAGIDVACDCREGLCGSCEVAVVEGEIDHRDMVLTRAERAESNRMMTCCSRSKNGTRIKLAL